MTHWLLRIPPAAPLRLGLAATYLYSGLSLIRDPVSWRGFVPPLAGGLIERVLPVERYLAVQGIFELALAGVFLAWFLNRRIVRLAAGLASAEFAAILFATGVDLATFRDFGLLGASLALWILASRRN